MKATVIKLTILPFTMTLPTLNDQILVLTAKSQINVTGQIGLITQTGQQHCRMINI
jgi:hypothetical protein